jgi:hypothetical protein
MVIESDVAMESTASRWYSHRFHHCLCATTKVPSLNAGGNWQKYQPKTGYRANGDSKIERVRVYSWRKARMGFIPAARRAGIQLAAMATAIRSAAEAANVMGSQERKP